MRYLLTGKQMKQVDKHAIHTIGIPSMVLMERAALAIARQAERQLTKQKQVVAACGNGNNGADGIAAARMLFLKGYLVTILLKNLDEHGTPEWEQQLKIAKKLGVPVRAYQETDLWQCDLLIDAVFGVGLSRELEGGWYDFVKALSAICPPFTIAVDIPSGIDSDGGKVRGVAIKADLTVTFGYQKRGTVLYPGRTYAGNTIVADIGFPDPGAMLAGSSSYTYGPEDLARLPARPPYSNKGSFGKVLIVAGSPNMSGAAFLSALAAYRTGAGLVKVVTAEANRAILQQQLPEAILETCEAAWAASPSKESCKWLGELLQWADVMVVGPGLGQSPEADVLVRNLLEISSIPTVIDADALNIVAADGKLPPLLKPNMILTPHLGEMGRLCKTSVAAIRSDLTKTAGQYSQTHQVVCVLKDAVTVVAVPGRPVYLNSSGNSGMAKAGSGDVLSGIIGGLLALGMSVGDAAVMGVYLHGCAGDRALEKCGRHSMIARDIIDQIGAVMERDNEKTL